MPGSSPRSLFCVILVLGALACGCASPPVTIFGEDSQLAEEIGSSCDPPRIDCRKAATALERAHRILDRYLAEARKLGESRLSPTPLQLFARAEAPLRDIWCSCPRSPAAGEALVRTAIAYEALAEVARHPYVPPDLPAAHRAAYLDDFSSGDVRGGWALDRAVEAHEAGLAIGQTVAPAAPWVTLARSRLVRLRSERPSRAR